ncbi:MAG: histidinol-phosphatase [Helicobacteraceae bacterium]|nr:histidinol-phosphatase [Helicobacteraceae bacterium]
MKLDLHNHTSRCNHAQGSMEDYVLEAIKEGVEVFGFSDHAPLRFDQGYRMSENEMDSYENEFFALKEKYADRIALRLGYEADYLPTKTIESVFSRKVDFLIGSVHFLGEWGFDNPESVFTGFDSDEFDRRGLENVWRAYFAAMADMAKSGRFNIVGHFDLIKLPGRYKGKKPDEAVIAALEAIKEANMAIEFNASGWRKSIGEQYPSIEILKIAYELKIPLTFGSDSHSPLHVAKELDRAYDLARSIGYKEAALFEDKKMRMVKI